MILQIIQKGHINKYEYQRLTQASFTLIERV